MIKHLLSLSFVAAAGFTASAQITVDQSDVATIGSVVLQARDTMPAAGIGPGASGANVTWNLSALDTHIVDTLTFTNPAWTPYSASFPSANLAVEMNGQYPGHAYLNNDPTGLWFLGQGDPMNGAVDSDPDELFFPFPATYGTAYTNTSSSTTKTAFIATGIDSVMYKRTISKSGNVDGWGTVITPLGSFNAIRSMEARTETDSLWVHTTGPFPPAGWMFVNDSVRTYDRYLWWANSVGFPLVEMDSSAAGVGMASWLLANPVITGTEDLLMAPSHTYPNPASDNVNITVETGDAARILVYDPTGRLVKTSDMSGRMIILPVHDLAGGMYFFVAVDNDGGALKKGKFTVKR